MTAIDEPLRLGAAVLRNRIVAAPMERNYCSPEGHVTDYYRAYLRRFADEGIGAICVEATFVQADGRGRSNQLGLHDDTCIPGVALLADELHARGTLLALELNHSGRTAQRAISGLPNVAPSPVACDVTGGGIPRALTHDEILAIIESFAAAARRAVRAGVDILVVHGAHGYLAHQFMSKLHNLRTDEWREPGRFTAEVVRAVRDAGPGVALGLRFSSVDGSVGGNTPDEQFDIVAGLPLDLLDFLDVSAGSYESGQWTIQSGEWAPGFLAEHAARYRSLGLPIGLAGRINSPEVARGIVDRGEADFVSVCRALHADPHWIGATLGARPDYRPCIACNACIDGLGVGPVVCTVNPDVGRASLVPAGGARAGHPATAGHAGADAARRATVPRPATAPRRALVAGAGPAGVTAALTLAEAGWAVTVVERTDRIGGAMADAATLDANPEWGAWLAWAERRLRAEVDVRLGTDAASIAGTFDDVVDARGGLPARPLVPGATDPRIVPLREWFGGNAPDGPLLFWGGDAAVLGLADHLASRGREITIVAASGELAPELGRRSRILTVPRLEANPRVRLITDTVIDEVRADGVVVTDAAHTRLLAHTGAIVMSQGLERRPPLPGATGAAGDAAGIPVSTVRHAIAHARDIASALAGPARTPTAA